MFLTHEFYLVKQFQFHGKTISPYPHTRTASPPRGVYFLHSKASTLTQLITQNSLFTLGFTLGFIQFMGFDIHHDISLDTKYIMENAGPDEAQAGIKIAGRNISNLRYADDTTLMAESKEELKNLLMKVKEESEKVGEK